MYSELFLIYGCGCRVGSSPKEVEGHEEVQQRQQLLRQIGYKL